MVAGSLQPSLRVHAVMVLLLMVHVSFLKQTSLFQSGLPTYLMTYLRIHFLDDLLMVGPMIVCQCASLNKTLDLRVCQQRKLEESTDYLSLMDIALMSTQPSLHAAWITM